MTQYFVDNREISAPFDASSLDQVLKYVERLHFKSTDAVIRQVRVDGQSIVPETPESVMQSGDWEKVEIFTGTMGEVAHESIGGAMEYLGKLEELIPALSLKFQDIPESYDFGDLRNLCEGFFFINMLLEKLFTGYQISLDQTVVQGFSVREHLRKFIGVLNQLNESQEQGNYLMIADTLEYEILPFISVWKDVFEKISGKVN